MEQWIYNNQLVASHSLYSACQSTLNSVSNRDYPNTNYFNPAIKCLDVDFYEKQVLCTSFSDIVKSSSDFPYTPIYPKENILNSIQAYCKNAEWDNFMKQVKYWCKKACEYQYKNPSEYEHIKDVITEIWKGFKHETHSLCEEEEFEMELLEEEFELLLMK